MKQTLTTGAIVLIAVLLGEIAAPFITPFVHGPASVQAEAEAELAARGPALYTPFDPPLLANFVDDKGATRYLQLGVQAMARDQKVIDSLQLHAPALRNAFLMLIANQDYTDTLTRDGKERLRSDMLLEARAILKRNAGVDGIEALYFTSFVVQ